MITKSTSKEDVLRLGTNCSKCGHCCSYGSGYTQEEELEPIAKHLKVSVEELKTRFFDKKNVFNKITYTPKLNRKSELPFGECIFQKNNLCTIHEVKPLHCRVGNCKEHGQDLSEWYAINFLVDKDNAESIRQWQVRVDLKPTIPGGHPKELVGEEKLRDILNYQEK